MHYQTQAYTCKPIYRKNAHIQAYKFADAAKHTKWQKKEMVNFNKKKQRKWQECTEICEKSDDKLKCFNF